MRAYYYTLFYFTASISYMERNLMSKPLFSAFFALVLVGLLSGCARRVIPEEVMQLSEYAPVYTAYNLWYSSEDGENVIDPLNVQKGNVLPFGTRITFVEADTKRIRFKRESDGMVFTALYDASSNLIPVENYIKQLFTTRNEADLSVGIRPLILEKIRRGLVEKGMSRKEVRLGYGVPSPLRTPSELVDTWTYYTDYAVTKKIVFFGNRVTEIIQLD